MEKILIVEDEPNMRLGLKDNLEFEGYEVDFADDGEEGLRKIIRNNYNLVLLDVMLPNMSGFDVCRTVRTEIIKLLLSCLLLKGRKLIRYWDLSLVPMIM